MSWPERLQQWRGIVNLAATLTNLAPELIAAVMDRESAGGLFLIPRGEAGTGDDGHGHGLMQIDDRYHAVWLAKRDEKGVLLWQQAEHNIPYGAELLKMGIDAMGGVPGGVAAYNASWNKVVDTVALYGQDVLELDKLTTHGDYVSDVLDRCRNLQDSEYG